MEEHTALTEESFSHTIETLQTEILKNPNIQALRKVFLQS